MPVVALLPAVLLTDQLTSLFGAPVTVAENDCVPPMRTLAPLGEIATLEFEPPPEPPPEPPDEPLLPLLVAPHPAETMMAADAHRTSSARANLDVRVFGRFVDSFFISGRNFCSACGYSWLAKIRMAGF